MKRIILPLLFLGFKFIVFAQQENAPINANWQRDASGNHELIYINKDYCDYYIVRNGVSFVASPGRTVGVRLSKNSSTYDRNMTPGSFYPYKGRFPDKFNPDFVYALPAKESDSVFFLIDKASSLLTFQVRIKPCDTVYAVRSGVVCMDDAYGLTGSKSKNRGNSILVYHQDYSFSDYTQLKKLLVKSGDKITVGQPIAIAQDVEGKKYKIFKFSVFFLDENKFTSDGKGSKYTHIYPIIHTQNMGDVKLKEKEKYLSELTDDLITQEMSKREKKKFEKAKAKK